MTARTVFAAMSGIGVPLTLLNRPLSITSRIRRFPYIPPTFYIFRPSYRGSRDMRLDSRPCTTILPSDPGPGYLVLHLKADKAGSLDLDYSNDYQYNRDMNSLSYG